METARERELQLQGRQAWPWSWPFLHTTAATTMDTSSSSSCGGGGGGVLLGWEWDAPPSCFGVFAAGDGAGVHDLFPLCMDAPPVSPAASPALPQAAAMPEELDDLFLNFWDASSYGDVFAEQQQQQQQLAFNSGCVLQSEKPSTTAAAITTNSLFYDDPPGSIFSAGPTLPEKAVVVELEPLLSSSSSSNCHAGPRICHVSGPPTQSGAAGAPPPRSSSSSLKRAAPAPGAEEAEAECSQSSGKRRKVAAAPAAGVVCPFTVLKPDGLDGGATLADINARILMRPARPVRHPVGEFACAPRVSADKPGISGKTVSGFTRLHTPGRGTITIIRTRG